MLSSCELSSDGKSALRHGSSFERRPMLPPTDPSVLRSEKTRFGCRSCWTYGTRGCFEFTWNCGKKRKKFYGGNVFFRERFVSVDGHIVFAKEKLFPERRGFLILGGAGALYDHERAAWSRTGRVVRHDADGEVSL